MIVFLIVFITRIVVPAYLMLGYWLLLQLISSIRTVAAESGGVALTLAGCGSDEWERHHFPARSSPGP